MKKHQTQNQATFAPQAYKTFEGSLEAFFAHECPQLGGFRTRQVLVSSISSMVRDFYPETTHLHIGQTPWVTVHKNEKASYGKRIKDTRLTQIVLDLVQAKDAQERAKGKKLRDIKKEAVARLFKQAYRQKGCLTNAEVAILLKISPSTVSKYTGEWELEHQSVLPRRGTIHDLGPTLTHKTIIIHKLFIEQKSVQQVSRETYHSPEAIQRYISTFRQVLLCRKKEFTTEQTAYVIRHTQRLVKEYEKIIEHYRQQGYIMDQLMAHPIDIENITPTEP